MMKELVVISGKGGTGKTSIVASFAALAQNAVLADCDVDAADLHLLLAPDVKQTADFSGGNWLVLLPKSASVAADEIAYDSVVTKAQIAAKSIVEYSNGSLKGQIISLWESVVGVLV